MDLRYDWATTRASIAVCTVVEAIAPTGDHGASRQPFQVPLPGTGIGLVEIIDVKGHASLWRGKDAEVGQVGITAEHRI